MSFLGKFYSGKKEEKKPPVKEDVLQKLRSTEESLRAKRQFVEDKIKQEAALAKNNSTTNKRVALNAIRQKQRYEKNLTQIDGTISNITQQRKSLEYLLDKNKNN